MISIVTLFITLVTESHDSLSRLSKNGLGLMIKSSVSFVVYNGALINQDSITAVFSWVNWGSRDPYTV